MSELPQGWRETNLGSLGKYHNGRGFKKSEWRDQGRPIIRIQNLTGSSDSFNYYQGDADERHVARQGDLLMSWAATLGAYIWTGPESVVNQHIFKVESNIDRKFHKYLLDFKLEELRRQAHAQEWCTSLAQSSRVSLSKFPSLSLCSGALSPYSKTTSPGSTLLSICSSVHVRDSRTCRSG